MDAIEIWSCRNCGKPLARIEHDDKGQRLLFDSTMLPSLIRDALGFVDVECPRCGQVRKWYKLDFYIKS